MSVSMRGRWLLRFGMSTFAGGRQTICERRSLPRFASIGEADRSNLAEEKKKAFASICRVRVSNSCPFSLVMKAGAR